MRFTQEEFDALVARGNIKVAGGHQRCAVPTATLPTPPTPVEVEKVKRRRRQEEHNGQVILFRRIDERSKTDDRYDCIFAIPNEAMTRARRKYIASEGGKSGIPDIEIAVSCGSFHGAFLELKTDDNDLRETQEEWRTRLIVGGYWYRAIYGKTEHEIAQNALDAIEEYFLLGGDR